MQTVLTNVRSTIDNAPSEKQNVLGWLVSENPYVLGRLQAVLRRRLMFAAARVKRRT
jgi:hypothetical protein